MTDIAPATTEPAYSGPVPGGPVPTPSIDVPYTPASSPTPAPQPQQTGPTTLAGALGGPTSPLGLGLSPSFESDVGRVAPFLNTAPSQAQFEQLNKANADVLRAEQQQKIVDAGAKDKAYSEYAGSARDALTRYRDEMAQSPLPAFVPTQETAGDISLLGSMLAVVGFMAGKGKGLTPGLDALDSMTGMLKGWQQGRKDLYEREYTQFKANFERLKAAHEEYSRELETAFKTAQVDLNKGLADANLAAVKAGDSVMVATIRQKGIAGALEIDKAQKQSMAQAAGLVMKMQETEALRLFNYAQQTGTPEERGQLAHAIATYQIPMPSGYALRSPMMRSVMADVYKQNPDYFASDYPKIQRALTAFAAGKQGDTIRALNVASYHLLTFKALMAAQQNGDTPLFNRIANEYAAQTGMPAPTNARMARQIVSQEVLKATGGSVEGVTDRAEFRSNLSPDASDEQAIGAVDTSLELMAGQLRGLERQYRTATTGRGAKNGLSLLDSDMIDPEVAKAFGPLIQGKKAASVGKFTVGQIINVNGKDYRVIGGDLNADPDVELVQ